MREGELLDNCDNSIFLCVRRFLNHFGPFSAGRATPSRSVLTLKRRRLNLMFQSIENSR